METATLLHTPRDGKARLTESPSPDTVPTSGRLRVLHVCTSDRGGGAEAVARHLSEIQTDSGDEGWLAVGRKQTADPKTVEIPNNHCRNPWSRFWLDKADALRSDGHAKESEVFARRLLGTLGDPRRAVERLLGREDFDYPGSGALLDTLPVRPDLVHCHNLHGGYFDLRALPSLSHTLPVFVTLHDAWMLTGHCAYSLGCDRWKTGCGSCPDLSLYPAVLRDGTAWNWRRKREIYRRTRLHVATPSRWLMRMLGQSALDRAAVDRRVIPNGIDLSRFRPGSKEASRERLGLPSDRSILLFVAYNARNACYKDYETLESAVLALAETSRTPLLCLALGSSGEPIRKARSEIRFIPYETDEDRIAHYYRAADAYVHATRADNHPLVVMEALASGTPVVATAVGGIPEQVRHGETGLLVPPRSPGEISTAVSAILSDPALQRSMSVKAAEDAGERFDLRRQAQSYREWYREVLDQQTRA